MNPGALKLTVYLGERHRTGDAFTGDALLELFARHGVRIAAMFRGAEGFGLKHHRRSDRTLTLSEDLPLVVLAVDARPRIEAMLDEVRGLLSQGLITLERVRLPDDGESPARDLGNDAAKLTVYVGRGDRVEGRPAHVAVCELLHERAVAGASVVLGVDGVVGGVRHRARFLGRNDGVPVQITAIGDGEGIARVLPELGMLGEDSLVTLERVRVCKRDGQSIDSPQEVPPTGAPGPGLWHLLTVHSSEQARAAGKPQHRAIVERLRRDGARGATTVRGIWGYHGDHPPHGDRLLQLRRHVPVVTTVIGHPRELARSFAIIDELTTRRGLVTSELVPALAAGDEHAPGDLTLAPAL